MYAARQQNYLHAGALGVNNTNTTCPIFTRLCSRRVVMCLVVVYVRSFGPTTIQLRVFNILTKLEI